MQNLPCGPTARLSSPTVMDDQFGGPAPDDAHHRMRSSGSTTTARRRGQSFSPPAQHGGEVAGTIKVLCHSIRNTFGMAFDPVSAICGSRRSASTSSSS
jgi:hypothetical protein